jgi:hypothetical protein
MSDILDFYNYQNNFIEGWNYEIIGQMKRRYWDQIKDYLNKKFKEWWTEEILELAKAYKDTKNLAYYIFYLIENKINIISDDKAQLAKLKNVLEENISAPSFEVFGWDKTTKYLFKWEKTKWIYNTEVKEIPTEKWLYKITYIVNHSKKSIYMRYNGRDKVTFHKDQSKDNYSYLWTWNIITKQKIIEKWNYNRYWKYYTERYIENSLITFQIKWQKLRLNIKFYNYN